VKAPSPYAAVAALLVAAGCDRGAPPAPAGPAPTAAPSTAAPNAAPAHHTVAVTLRGLKIEVTIPGGWETVQNQYDPSGGTAVFEPNDDSGEKGTSFVDASKDAHVPESAAKALAEVTARDGCSGPGGCTVLANEAVPGGGYLVSVREAKGVFVESWRTVASGRALRCGFELSEIVVATLHGGTWLDDATAVGRARKEGEDLCRSVKPAG
jgi:hypothetical protein